MASALYDIMPVLALILEESEAMGQSTEAYLDARTRWQAQKDSAGVYAAFLRLTNASAIARRLPMLITQHLDFAKGDDIVVEPKQVSGDIRGIPAMLGDWLLFVMNVYSEVVLGRTGAKDVRCREIERADDLPVLGIPTKRLRVELTWR